MSRAFTAHTVVAALAFPLLFVAVLCYMLRRAAYLDDTRSGVVIIARYNPVLDMLLVVAVVLPASLLFGALAGFAEAASELLMSLGIPPGAVRVERFGPSG